MSKFSFLRKTLYVLLFLSASKVFSFDQLGVSLASFAAPKPKTNFSMGLLHNSTYHSNFNQTFYSLEAKGQALLGDSSALVYDGFGLLKLQGEGSSFYSLKELYYTQTVSPNLSYSVGRKINEWSSLNEYLPTGFWNNAWDFNKASPVEEGLFGVFVDLKMSKKSRINFFASPVSIPKLTEHYKFNKSGGVDPTTTWFVPPPSEVEYQGTTYNTKYDLDLDIASVVLKPQLGFIYDYSSKGYFLKTSYLYAPSKDVDMSIDFALNASEETTPVDITVDPSVEHLHKMGLEMGFNWERFGKTTFSVNHKERESDLQFDPLGRKSFVGLSSGTVYQIAHDFRLLKGRLKTQIHVLENTNTQNLSNGELDEFLLESLSVPFRFRRGGGVKNSFALTQAVKFGAYLFYDVQNDGVLGDLKVKYNRKKLSLTAGLNFVEALSKESGEFYKDFRRNDSYYMGVSHVF